MYRDSLEPILQQRADLLATTRSLPAFMARLPRGVSETQRAVSRNIRAHLKIVVENTLVRTQQLVRPIGQPYYYIFPRRWGSIDH